MKQFIKEAQRLQKLAGITEVKDYFKGSYFGDDDGNDLYSVEKVYDFVKKNKTKYLKNNFPLDSIKHNLKWWGKHYDINNKDHKERMMNADTSYPLLVIKEKNGNLSVADGLNRLYKAIKIEKKEKLPVYFISDKSDIKDLKKTTNTNEAKVVPQRIPRRLKGQIGPNFTTDELITNYDTDESQTIFETPQGFRFNMAPYPIRNGEVLIYELQYNDYDPDPGIEEWIDDQVNELKQQLSNAGYKLEVAPFNGGMMLYIPV